MHNPAEEEFRLRPLTEPDLPLLAGWIQAPHVGRWWHEPVGLADVRTDYLPCIQGTDPTHALILEVQGQPAGFAQWYRWVDNLEHAGKLGAFDDEAGLDYLLAEPGRCGHGLGTRLIAAILAEIVQTWPEVGGVLVDPEEGNRASRRVLEKNGLSLVRVVEIADPSGYPIGPTAIYRRRFSAPPR
ncbi:MAG: acetyltransferase [Actinomycetota bacterium]|nr:acetyltransferase [Actinomycetota bacterium]MDQ2955661.1 acetyltransferase [Actinomycetota bacterium]